MSWNTFVSSAGIRSDVFGNYESAKAHYDDVKPIRGRANDQRPLGRNRSTYSHCQIKFDPLTDGVSAHLYDTHCLSIYPSGRIELRTGSWVTPSTANFIEACLPSKFGSVYLSKRRVIYKTRGGKEYIIPKTGCLVLQAVGSDGGIGWDICDVAPNQGEVTASTYEYKADRKVLNQIRKHYAGFLATLDVMSAMSSSYSISEVCEYYPNVALRYVDKVNAFEKKKREDDERAKLNPQNRHYPANFNGQWELRGIVENYAGLPRMTRLSDMANTLKAVQEGKDLAPWIKQQFKELMEQTIPAYNNALKEAESDDVWTLRKLMVGIATNAASYGHYTGEWGENVKTETVPTNFGEVQVPSLRYDLSKQTIENFFVDIIKYFYADKIFKQVEVPAGTIAKTTNEKYVILNRFLLENSDLVTTRHSVPV